MRPRETTSREGPLTPPPARSHGPLLRPEQAAELLAVKTSWVYEAVGRAAWTGLVDRPRRATSGTPRRS
jgi:hypothetical protein